MTDENKNRREVMMEEMVDHINSETDIDNLRGYAISMLLRGELTGEAASYAYMETLSSCTPEEVPTMERFRENYDRRYKENMLELAMSLMAKVFGTPPPGTD